MWLKWNNGDCKKVKRTVYKLQSRIYKASLNGGRAKVKFLQSKIIGSKYAKLLSVRRVTSQNYGKYTAAINSRVYDIPNKKIQLVNSLKVDWIVNPALSAGYTFPRVKMNTDPLESQHLGTGQNKS